MRTVISLAVCFLLTILPLPLMAEAVRMAVFMLEPFMMELPLPQSVGPQHSLLTGVTVEYWRQYLAPKMGIDLEVVGPYPIVRAIKLLETGEVDIVSQLTKIPERVPVYSIFRDTEKGHRLRDSYDRANAEGMQNGVFASLTELYIRQGEGE